MATFRRRGKKWRVEICHQGNRLSASFTTKVECERWATVTLYELTHNAQHPSVRKTLKEALARYLNECTPKKRGATREAKFIHRMMQHGICDHLLENVTTTHWAEWRDQRLTSVSPATVIREFTVIKAVYKTAITEWLWLRVSPLTNLKLPKAPPPRDRRVFPEEQQKMLEAFKFTELRTPEKIREFVACAWLFALETAMRSGEILNLQWQHVHLAERYIHIPTSKNGTKRDVPLSKRAMEILEILPRDNPTCFKISATQRDANFRKYRKLAEIQDMTFHDSRHEALTRLAQKLHILDLARMAGMRNTKTLMIYYNATASEIAKKLD
ncbi:site-specific integrase [Cardiobacterium hominis]|uniref:tyrosine-type recombinase/integrase n=1 Tax=Cardiobacterium hominis TaxID=2718 RepID=UPI0028E2AE04|nr:site-specific integrase [Cardiobacterium hominis]